MTINIICRKCGKRYFIMDITEVLINGFWCDCRHLLIKKKYGHYDIELNVKKKRIAFRKSICSCVFKSGKPAPDCFVCSGTGFYREYHTPKKEK